VLGIWDFVLRGLGKVRELGSFKIVRGIWISNLRRFDIKCIEKNFGKNNYI
jgi:hypothetical protein